MEGPEPVFICELDAFNEDESLAAPDSRLFPVLMESLDEDGCGDVDEDEKFAIFNRFPFQETKGLKMVMVSV